MNLFSRVLGGLCLSALLAGHGTVWAQSGEDGGPQKTSKESDSSSLPESVRRVERQTGGEVLRAEPMQRDGREVYRLKVLTADGRVRVVQDDPSEHKRERTQRQQPRAERGDQRDAPDDRGDGESSQRQKRKRPSRDPDGASQQY